jgi:hypothetical protein
MAEFELTLQLNRVTRQDNVVAQALLEKAIAIDPSYGQALGVLATSQTFGAHMGWADMATTIPIAERAALAAILADSADPWAHNALGCVYLLLRRFVARYDRRHGPRTGANVYVYADMRACCERRPNRTDRTSLPHKCLQQRPPIRTRRGLSGDRVQRLNPMGSGGYNPMGHK